MCGICGTFWTRSGRPADLELVRSMNQRIVHRGPDDEGYHVDDSFAFGMRRLAIIDLDAGNQPIFNEDRTIGVIQNGEIYNFKQLRQDLAARGHAFTTQSDTEVLVHLYEEFGLEFATYLNGMFAIALWDASRRRLVLVRDRLGKKPLYYTWTADGIVFGSELKCLIASGEISNEMDPAALYHYFNLGYVPHPFSIYKQVRQLEPAEQIVVEQGEFTRQHYWRVPPAVDTSCSMDDAITKLQYLLDDSVRLRMMSDVPLGAFLSGGLDSSIIVALMARHSSQPIKTFHIDFEGPAHSERQFAKSVAQRYGTDHYELKVEASAIDVFDSLVDAFDEPFGDASAIPTYYVSQLTRQHVTVALAGDGGDESFGGYKRYRDILARRSLSASVRSGLGCIGQAIHHLLPRSAPGRRYFRSLGMSDEQLFAVGVSELEAGEFFDPEFMSQLANDSTYGLLSGDLQRCDRTDPLARFSSLDLYRYLPDDILTKVDRTSMANSLELRAPLLDYRIVEFAAQLPYNAKIQGEETKVILKRAFKDLLPDDVLQQRKRGFSPPVENWLRDELRPLLEEALHDPLIEQSGIFRLPEIRAMAEEHFSHRRGRRSLLWRYLFFTRWYHRHLERTAHSYHAAASH
ncbi:MAG: asparagine synthase (glutamine-hydrolyzing) [Planctomycetales bacterium]|nr:asparagine synthase (glutamine-hydrolyzing) [Planctomycetales bacterium]